MKYMLACSGMMLDIESFIFLREKFQGKYYELRSYWEVRDFTGHTLKTYGKEFFMDSGAFSARTLGLDIDVKTYGNFIKKYGNQIHEFANLDAIPQSNSAEDMLIAAKQTWHNQRVLEDITGRVPLPVYHKGEPATYLSIYLENYKYICIGGLMNKICSNKSFFDFVWRENTKNGKPWRKFHAFGLSSIKHLLRYPWYSADSSSWLIQAKTGIVSIPHASDNGYNFLVAPELIAISDKAGARKYDGFHFDTFPDYQKKYIINYLNSIGIKLEDMRNEAYYRMYVNMHWWREFGEASSKKNVQIPNKQISLL